MTINLCSIFCCFSKWGLYSNINTYKWNISSNITMYYGVFTFNLKMYNLFYHEWWKKPNQIIKNPNKLPKPKWKKIFLFSKYESSFRIFRICIDFIEFYRFRWYPSTKHLNWFMNIAVFIFVEVNGIHELNKIIPLALKKRHLVFYGLNS